MRRIVVLGTVVASLFLGGAFVSAQGLTSPDRFDPRSSPKTATDKNTRVKSTVIQMELLQTDTGSGVSAQHWSRALGPLNISLTIRRPMGDELPEVKEREVGMTRYVTLIGTLDRSGQIAFPGKSFEIGDMVKLTKWIDELKTYGAQGTPSGKPMWGMTKGQFSAVFESLVKPCEFETMEIPLKDVIAKLPLPAESPLRWSNEATQLLVRKGSDAELKSELKGLSAGTVLAIGLNESGLGFRPNRTPSGEIELLIEPNNPQMVHWPIGWPLEKQTFKAAPKYYAMTTIDLTDAILGDVLEAASKLTETPILVDYPELESKHLNLEKIKVSFPKKKTNWNVAISRMVGTQRLTQEIWQDEAGKLFSWITTTRAGRPDKAERPVP